MKKTIFFIAISTIFLFGCTKKVPTTTNIDAPKPVVIENGTDKAFKTDDAMSDDQYQKLCGWIDKADIKIKVNFADGVEKQSAYETGFYYDSITSNMHVARKDCDYRVGFTYNEVPANALVEVGVRGYSDNKRRTIQSEPINVKFNAGVPDIGNNIEVTITD